MVILIIWMGGRNEGYFKMTVIYTPATLPENLKHKDTNKLVYTPSLAGVITRQKWNIRWWGDGAPFQHPALLISAFNGLQYWDFREKFEIPRKNFTFFADSGGFQILNKGVYLDPLDVLKWMEHNADIGAMLDTPPNFESGALLGKEFKTLAKKSLKNYEKMDRNRKESNFKLYKPIHGNNTETLNWWYNYVKDVPCDGYASSPRRPSAELAAFTLSFAIHNDLHNFHLFLGTGFHVIPVIVYASKFLKNLSFDSSSFSLMGGRLRQYIMPLFFNVSIPFGRGFDGKLKELPCFCPVCNVSTPEAMNAETAEGAGLILLHDLYMYLINIKVLNKLVDDTEKYKEVIRRNFPTNTMKAIESIDATVEGKFDETFKSGKSKELDGFV